MNTSVEDVTTCECGIRWRATYVTTICGLPSVNITVMYKWLGSGIRQPGTRLFILDEDFKANVQQWLSEYQHIFTSKQCEFRFVTYIVDAILEEKKI